MASALSLSAARNIFRFRCATEQQQLHFPKVSVLIKEQTGCVCGSRVLCSWLANSQRYSGVRVLPQYHEFITVYNCSKMLSISLFRFTVPANLNIGWLKMTQIQPLSFQPFPLRPVSQFPTPPVVCNSPCFRFPLRLCLPSISPRGLVSWEWSRWWGHGDSVGSEVFTPERLCATHTQQLAWASVHLFFFVFLPSMQIQECVWFRVEVGGDKYIPKFRWRLVGEYGRMEWLGFRF
jgi:hypothetical protein